MLAQNIRSVVLYKWFQGQGVLVAILSQIDILQSVLKHMKLVLPTTWLHYVIS